MLKLPTLAEVNAIRRATPKHAIPTIKVEKAQKKRAEQKVVKSVRAQVVERAGGRCERCGRPCRQSGEAHHKVKRSQGGKWTLENIEFICRTCHGLAHGVKR